MKKLLIFALLIVPVASFGAPSVRVLGTGTTPVVGTKTKTTSSAARVTPSKVTAAKPAAAATASNAATSRIGTIRVKPKTTTGTLTGSSTGTTTVGSRFPVITPAHSYKTVGTQQAAGNTSSGTVRPQPVGIGDDPRFDMILSDATGPKSAAQIRADWVSRVGEDLVRQRENEGYVFMWVEE